MPSATEDVLIEVGSLGGGGLLRIKFSSSTSDDLLSVDDLGVTTVTNTVEGRNGLVFQTRATDPASDQVMLFLDSASTTVASIDLDGRWRAVSDEGVALKVETSVPATLGFDGAARLYHQTAPSGADYYFILLHLGGSWKKVPLPN